MTEGQEMAPARGTELAVREEERPQDRAARRAVVRQAMKGGSKAQEMQALALVRAHPGDVQVQWGNPRNGLLDAVCAHSPVMREVVKQEYQRDVQEMAGANPTPLETLLAERIVVLRFQITHSERTYALRFKEGMSLAVSDHHQKRIDRLHQRYVSAIKALAQLRRLQLPAVQVNIGGQQVNVAGGARRGIREAIAAAGEP